MRPRFRLWSAAARLLPRRFRETFGAELGDLVTQLSRDARARGGRRAQLAYLCREWWALGRLAIESRRGLSVAVLIPRSSAESTPILGGIAGDVRWAVRQARRRALQTSAVVGTLTLAIAAATIAYGLATAVLWRPLPFRDPSRLVFVWERNREAQPMRVTAWRYAAWRDTSSSFSSMALFSAAGFTLEEPDGLVSVRGVRVSAGYFDTLGVAPLLGRAFTPADERPGQHQVVLLSHELWQQRFGGRPEAIGAILRLSGQPYTVVGVMPRVVFPGWPVNPAAVTIEPDARQLWVPIPRTAGFEQNARSHVFGIVARLAADIPMARAAEELNLQVETGAPDTHGGALTPLREQFVRDARLPLLLLTAAAAAVLLIACANLAALLVTGFEARRQEFGIRTALGAGVVRLSRQLLVEALTLAVTGGLLGTALSGFALQALPKLLPASVPFLTPPTLDARVAAFGIGVSVLTAVILAAWPVARLIVTGAAPRATPGRARRVVFRGLVVAQVSITVALAVCAGLLGQSLWSVRRQDPGFLVDRVLVADVALSAGYRNPGAVLGAEQRIRDAISARGGVEAVALAYDHPLEANWTDAYKVVGQAEEAQSDASRQAELRIVSPEYFEALGVELLDGRTFTGRESLGARGAAVVNEAFSRAIGGRVVGRRLQTQAARLTWGSEVPVEFDIVGIVENERFRGLEQPGLAAVYLSTRHFPLRSFALLVRTAGNPLDLAGDLRSVLRAVEPAATVTRPTSLADILSQQLVARRVTTDVVGGFAAAALALAALGLYGLLAVFVSSRTREIGIRLALGAAPSAIRREVVGESVRSTAAGITVGILLALVAGRIINGLLVDVTPHDPATLAAVGAILMLVAGAAAWVPARRAAHVDPIHALRHD